MDNGTGGNRKGENRKEFFFFPVAIPSSPAIFNLSQIAATPQPAIPLLMSDIASILPSSAQAKQ